MGQLKHKLLFYGFTSTAYISPLLMIISLSTNYWLFSTEKIITRNIYIRDKITASELPLIITTRNNILSAFTTSKNPLHNITGLISLKSFEQVTSNIIFESTNPYYNTIPSADYTEANYGLWRMCRITDASRQKRCEFIKYFQGSESENRLTDTLKRNCTIPILLSLVIMMISAILHSYALIRRKLHYIFLLSGCLFIFAGLSSLTGLVVFIAAVNSVVDSKLTMNKSKEEEPPFKYGYGISFYCAVSSFLFQELNGICNIYWYIDYYRKYRFEKQKRLSKKNKNNKLASATNSSKNSISAGSRSSFFIKRKKSDQLSTQFPLNEIIRFNIKGDKNLPKNTIKIIVNDDSEERSVNEETSLKKAVDDLNNETKLTKEKNEEIFTNIEPFNKLTKESSFSIINSSYNINLQNNQLEKGLITTIPACFDNKFINGANEAKIDELKQTYKIPTTYEEKTSSSNVSDKTNQNHESSVDKSIKKDLNCNEIQRTSILNSNKNENNKFIAANDGNSDRIIISNQAKEINKKNKDINNNQILSSQNSTSNIQQQNQSKMNPLQVFQPQNFFKNLVSKENQYLNEISLNKKIRNKELQGSLGITQMPIPEHLTQSSTTNFVKSTSNRIIDQTNKINEDNCKKINVTLPETNVIKSQPKLALYSTTSTNTNSPESTHTSSNNNTSSSSPSNISSPSSSTNSSSTASSYSTSLKVNSDLSSNETKEFKEKQLKIFKKDSDKTEEKLDLEENELKVKFYKLNDNNSNEFYSDKINLNKINRSILINNYRSEESIFRKYSNYDDFYDEDSQQQPQTNNNQRCRQNSFRRAPKVFYYSQDNYCTDRNLDEFETIKKNEKIDKCNKKNKTNYENCYSTDYLKNMNSNIYKINHPSAYINLSSIPVPSQSTILPSLSQPPSSLSKQNQHNVKYNLIFSDSPKTNFMENFKMEYPVLIDDFNENYNKSSLTNCHSQLNYACNLPKYQQKKYNNFSQKSNQIKNIQENFSQVNSFNLHPLNNSSANNLTTSNLKVPMHRASPSNNNTSLEINNDPNNYIYLTTPNHQPLKQKSDEKKVYQKIDHYYPNQISQINSNKSNFNMIEPTIEGAGINSHHYHLPIYKLTSLSSKYQKIFENPKQTTKNNRSKHFFDHQQQNPYRVPNLARSLPISLAMINAANAAALATENYIRKESKLTSNLNSNDYYWDQFVSQSNSICKNNYCLANSINKNNNEYFLNYTLSKPYCNNVSDTIGINFENDDLKFSHNFDTYNNNNTNINKAHFHNRQHKIKNRPMIQRNKSTDYQPITKFVIENQDLTNDLSISLIQPSNHRSEYSNAQILRRNLKRTTSV